MYISFKVKANLYGIVFEVRTLVLRINSVFCVAFLKELTTFSPFLEKFIDGA